MNIDRLKQELKDLNRLIGRKITLHRIILAKLPDLQKKYEERPSLLNKAELANANADKANLEAELYLLEQRQILLKNQIASAEKNNPPQPGGPC